MHFLFTHAVHLASLTAFSPALKETHAQILHTCRRGPAKQTHQILNHGRDPVEWLLAKLQATKYTPTHQCNKSPAKATKNDCRTTNASVAIARPHATRSQQLPPKMNQQPQQQQPSQISNKCCHRGACNHSHSKTSCPPITAINRISVSAHSPPCHNNTWPKLQRATMPAQHCFCGGLL